MTSTRAAAWHGLVAGVFLTAFVGMGAITFDALHRQNRVLAQTPTASSDLYLQADLGVAGGMAAVHRCLDGLAKGSVVAVISRPGTHQSLSAQMILLALWERGMNGVDVAAPDVSLEQKVRARHAAAIFHLDGEPPAWLAQPERLGTSLSFGKMP
jgi:hypothetical protein